MLCKEYSVKLPDDAQFCDSCGSPVENEASKKSVDWIVQTK